MNGPCAQINARSVLPVADCVAPYPGALGERRLRQPSAAADCREFFAGHAVAPSIGSHARVMPFQTLPVEPCLSHSLSRFHSAKETTLPVHVSG